MDLIKVQSGQIIVAEDVLNLMKELKKKAIEFQQMEKTLKEQLVKAMRENHIKQFENDVVSITYKLPYTRTSVDSKKLKSELPSIWQEYAKHTEVKESVVMTWK